MVPLSLLVCAAAFSAVNAAPNKIPWKDWAFCKKSDPKINECLIKSINNIRSDIIEGSTYFGTPSLDPLHLTKIHVDQGGGSHRLAVNLTFLDIDILGLRSYELVESKANWDTGDLWGKLKVHDPITIAGNYRINGKVLILPIQGEGVCNLTLVNTVFELKMKVEKIEKKGKEYFQSKEMEVFLEPTKLHIYLGNLFNGNKELGDNMNKVINENWKDLLADLRGSLSDALSQVLTIMTNKVFGKIPVSTVAPE